MGVRVPNCPAAGNGPLQVGIHVPLGPTDAADLLNGVRLAIATTRSGAIRCTLTGPVDFAVVDLLARLQLFAHQNALRLQVVAHGDDVARLLELSGLDDLIELVD